MVEKWVEEEEETVRGNRRQKASGGEMDREEEGAVCSGGKMSDGEMGRGGRGRFVVVWRQASER